MEKTDPVESARATQLSSWHYERAEEPGIVEFVQWTDNGLPQLRMHFHSETQVTIVLSGSRSFLADGQILAVRAGQFAVIPAGLPHRAQAGAGSVGQGFNLYLQQPIPASEPTIGELSAGCMKAAEPDFRAIAERVLNLNSPSSSADNRKVHQAAAAALAGAAPFEKLADIAGRHGLTREAYSRGVARQLGMPPHQYRTVDRLNYGRERLRSGESVATIATELEFADQSHFTRLFRSTFGITPGRYRKAFE